MPANFVGIKLKPDLLERVDSYASACTGGNRSAAIAELIESGLRHKEVDEEMAASIADAVEKAMERVEDSIVRISSRGAKASLANLILCSTFLPAIADMEAESAKVSAILHGKDPYDETFDGMAEAAAYIHDFHLAHPGEVFDFAWKAGGIAHNSGRRVSYTMAVSKARG